MTTTETEQNTDLVSAPVQTPDSGDQHFSHIVWMPDDKKMTAATYVLVARIEGFPIKGLCGFEWVPSRDPKEHPVCGKCLEIWKAGGHENKFGDAEGLDS